MKKYGRNKREVFAERLPNRATDDLGEVTMNLGKVAVTGFFGKEHPQGHIHPTQTEKLCMPSKSQFILLLMSAMCNKAETLDIKVAANHEGITILLPWWTIVSSFMTVVTATLLVQRYLAGRPFWFTKSYADASVQGNPRQEVYYTFNDGRVVCQKFNGSERKRFSFQAATCSFGEANTVYTVPSSRVWHLDPSCHLLRTINARERNPNMQVRTLCHSCKDLH